MSLVISTTEQVTDVTTVDDVTTVTITETPVVVSEQVSGIQGPKGDTGATGPTGATGATGPSGVVSVTAPITNSGTSTAAIIGINAGVPNGVATLDGSGLVPTTQLPPLAVNDTFVVASQAAMLALTAQTGDIAVRTDSPTRTFILTASPASTLGNWQEILTPPGVTSVTASSPLTGGTITSTGTIGIQSASTTQSGAVQLNDTVTSTSTSLAATANSVKTAYDLANAALPKTGGTVNSTTAVDPVLVVKASGIATVDITSVSPNTPPASGRTVYGVSSLTGISAGTVVTISGIGAATSGSYNGTFTVVATGYSGGTNFQVANTATGTPSPSTGTATFSASPTNAQIWQNSSGTTVASITSTGAITGSGIVTSGANSGTQGQVKLNGSTSGTATITTPAAAGTPTLTLPTTTGFLLRGSSSDVDGSLLTGINATNITTGILAVANGGTGVSTSTGTGSNVLSSNAQFGSALFTPQATPVNMATATTSLTTANMLVGILTYAAANTANGTATVQTGTNMENYLNSTIFGGTPNNDISFEWTVINLNTTYTLTVAANTGHTVVGNMVVGTNSSGRFRSRKSATNTFITYRIA